MLKLYKVENMKSDWDSWDRFIVWAENPKQALEIIYEYATYTENGHLISKGPDWRKYLNNPDQFVELVITVIETTNKPQIIESVFLHG